MAGEKLRTCFVVGPIGDEGTEIRDDADWVLDEIITPALEKVGGFATPVRSDRQEKPGMIDAQMFAHLFDDDLVIADMTGLNANAFYEIGIRHMVEKPIIHLHQVGTKIPFDVMPHRSISYSLARSQDLKAARSALIQQISEAVKPEFHVENPVTNARGRINLRKSADPSDRALLDVIESLSKRLSAIEDRGAIDANKKTSSNWTTVYQNKGVSVSRINNRQIGDMLIEIDPNTDQTLRLDLARLLRRDNDLRNVYFVDDNTMTASFQNSNSTSQKNEIVARLLSLQGVVQVHW